MSPVRSKSQWRALAAKRRAGQISQAMWEEWTKGVKYDSLPEKVKKKRRK